MCEAQVGAQSSLFATGWFEGAAGNGISRWNGTTWVALGSGIPFGGEPVVGELISSVVSFDDGTGMKLYAGGHFVLAGRLSVNRIACWDGTTWSDVGGGINGTQVVPDVGTFGPNIMSMAVHDDGTGPALYVGGSFTSAGGQPCKNIAKWNGTTWSSVGLGFDYPGIAAAFVDGLTVWDDGSGGGDQLIAAGGFSSVDGRGVHALAKWNGSAWSALKPGEGVQASVRALAVGNEPTGDGPAVFAGGDFRVAGEAATMRVAQWDGFDWEPIPNGPSAMVRAVLARDDGFGACPSLYVGGDFTTLSDGSVMNRIARWDGANWLQLTNQDGVGGGASPTVRALADFQGELFVGGRFVAAGGAAGYSAIASWNGAWSNPGALTGGDGVHALTTWNDGSGPALYLGGTFTSAMSRGGPLAVARVARYDGTSYSALGSGLPSTCLALAIHDDGSGAKLHAGGNFGVRARDGVAWNALPSLGVGNVAALASLDDGSGPALYAGIVRNGTAIPTLKGIVKWDGVAWTEVGGGVTHNNAHDEAPQYQSVSGEVFALASTVDPASRAPVLFLGGRFERAGSQPSSSFAAWRGCGGSEPGTAFCFGDGSLATACPCAPPNVVPSPSGAPNAGCANSFNLDGARLRASGTTNPDTIVLEGVGQAPSAFAFFFVGTAELAGGFAVGDGVRCADGALTRFGSQFAVCGTVKYPNPALGLTLPVSTVSGTTPGSGATRRYQVLYRNAAAGFCAAAGTVNLTSGYRITW